MWRKCHYSSNKVLTGAVYWTPTYHVLSLGKDSKERVMPLLNVNVQEPGARQGATAGAAHVPVQGVVVVLVLLQRDEDRTAAWDVTGKLWHTDTRQGGGGGGGGWMTLKHWDVIRHQQRGNIPMSVAEEWSLLGKIRHFTINLLHFSASFCIMYTLIRHNYIPLSASLMWETPSSLDLTFHLALFFCFLLISLANVKSTLIWENGLLACVCCFCLSQ